MGYEETHKAPKHGSDTGPHSDLNRKRRAGVAEYYRNQRERRETTDRKKNGKTKPISRIYPSDRRPIRFCRGIGTAPRLHRTVRRRRSVARRSYTDPRRETLQFRLVPLRLEYGRIFRHRQKIRGRSVVAAGLRQPQRIGAILHQR